MNDELPPECEHYLETAITSGLYPDRSQALEEAVRLLQQRDTLQSKLAEAARELQAGEGSTAEGVFDRLDERINQIEHGGARPETT